MEYDGLTIEQVEREKKYCGILNNGELFDYAIDSYNNYFRPGRGGRSQNDSSDYDRYWIARKEILKRMNNQ